MSETASGVRGFVEIRGPDVIAGWAWRPDAGPLKIAFNLDGTPLGHVIASAPRPDLVALGMGDAGFVWPIPPQSPPLDPGRIEVVAEDHDARLPDVGGLVVTQPAAAETKGFVERRGPEVISGWVAGAGGPMEVELRLGRRTLARVRADLFRQDLKDAGVGGGLAGFQWRIPLSDPPLDVARVQVRARDGTVVPDRKGLEALTPPLARGRVEARGPDAISGWAQATGGPARLRLSIGDETLAEITASQPRPDLEEQGFNGAAGFCWLLPFGDAAPDPAAVRVTEATCEMELPDLPGLVPVRPGPVRGVVEERSYRQVSGWAWDGRPGGRLKIEIVQDGEVIATCAASKPRPDLAARGVDDGRHGFSWTPPRGLAGFDASRVTVRTLPGGHELPRTTPRRAGGLKLEAPRLHGGWIRAAVIRTGEGEPPQALDVVCDGRFLLRADILALAYDAGGRAELAIELPRQLNDGRPHAVGLHDPREGDLIAGQEAPLELCSTFNAMVELVDPREIRGWVVDPDDPEGEITVELFDNGRPVRSVGLGRDRPQVAEAMGAVRAREFSFVRLPGVLFDGEEHELTLSSAGRPIAPQGTPDIRVRWSRDMTAQGAQRFEGAVEEVNPISLKGHLVDYVDDAPRRLEVLVDGEVVGRPMADLYVARLKDRAGHGFHGFDCRLPSRLMNGRQRTVEVRVADDGYVLPPGRKPLLFPLTAVGESPPDMAPPALRPPAAEAREPALLSLIVLNLDGAHVLEPMLRSLAETAFRDRIEVILIDHGSSDETHEVVEAYRGRMTLVPVYRGANHSFSASCNLGAALAKGAHLVFLNNDIVFTGDCLAPMRDLLDAEPEVGLVGLRLLEPRYRGEGAWETAPHHTGVRFRVLVSQDKAMPRMYHPVEVADGGEAGAVIQPAVTAALSMMRKADFRAVGGFDERYHYGYEDVDLALRLRARLGRKAACRLDVSAVHNRSATREAKLARAAAGRSPALARPDAHANLDLFIRRFSRHVPRLILSQLVQGGEAWRAEPLRVTFVVADPAQGADAEAARRLGERLREAFGWEPMLLAEDGKRLAQTDVLISLRPGFDLRMVEDAAPGLVTIAWPFGGPASWEDRADLCQLSLDLSGDPARQAAALRAALADFLSGDRLRVAIKAQAENEPHAHALAEALRARGQHVRIDGPRRWIGGLTASDELVVAMAGVRAYVPHVGAVNMLALTPGAEVPSEAERKAYDLVFEPGEAEADAARLVESYEALRREFLGGLVS